MTTRPVVLFTLCLLVVTSLMFDDDAACMIGVPRPDPKTGLSMEAVFS